MRSDLLAVLAERAGTAMKRHLQELPWLCLSCEHCQVDEGVPAPQVIRALSNGSLTCALSLPLPCGGRPCDGFCPYRERDSNKKHTQATNGLPSSVDCCTMGAPNTKRRHKSLSDSPRAGKILVTAFAVYACRFFGQVFAHIGQICNVRGPVRARRLLCGRGTLQICPFSFPEHKEVFNG